MSDNVLTDFELSEIHALQSKEEEQAKAKKLPAWVKCMYCGERPRWGDLLGEVIKGSSALAHQSCMKARGKLFGLNAGTIQEIGGNAVPEGVQS